MCGIISIFSTQPIDPNVLVKMNNLIRHRGPDDEGFVFFHQDGVSSLGGNDTPESVFKASIPYRPVGLLESVSVPTSFSAMSHRRLSIQDLSPLGHQPMSYLVGRYWIVFNGEIYNFPEIRMELEALGYGFNSHSDTEVILAAYDCWGAECLSRFNGMWALVIFDTLKKLVFIARDRFGVKPLYWWTDGSVFLIASEIKAFLAHPRFSAQPNLKYLKEYLNFGPQEFLEECAFLGVHRLGHSRYILSSPHSLISKNFETIQWWNVAPNLSEEPYIESKAKEYADKYIFLLRDAVQLRLRADVRVGSALSGGLDSSSIVYLMNQVMRANGVEDKQETFSTIYPSPGTEDCDESGFIRLIADALSVHSNVIEPHAEDIAEEHAKMIWAMDTPPESTCMSGWHTFKLAQRCGIKVTLDGQGADEQLAGYLRYLSNWINDAPITSSFIQAPNLIKIHPTQVVAQAYAGSYSKKLLPGPVLKVIAGRRQIFSRLDLSLNELLVKDMFSSLITLLHYSDRVSMAHSVESRMPFIDYRIVEFLASIPGIYKIWNGWTKNIARIAFDGFLPDCIVKRKDKLGWPIPERQWFNGTQKAWFETREESGYQYCKDNGLLLKELSDYRMLDITRRVRLINIDAWFNAFIFRSH